MLEDALSALADYVEANRSYRAPMKMVFDEEAASLLFAAEGAGTYGGLSPEERDAKEKEAEREAQLKAKEGAAGGRGRRRSGGPSTSPKSVQ